MSKELASLDLGLAWRRVKHDVQNRVFIGHPYSITLIESDLNNWLNGIRQKLANGTYAPSLMFVCDVPKENGPDKARESSLLHGSARIHCVRWRML